VGTEKFGVQARKTPFVTLFRNGDKFHKGERFKIKFSNFDQMVVAASAAVQLSTGAVKKFYKPNCKSRVTTLEGFEDGAVYLCCGGEKPKLNLLPPGLGFVEKAAPAAK
jgi:hypothetical protein